MSFLTGWPLTVTLLGVVWLLLIVLFRETNRYWHNIGIAYVKPELFFGNARELFFPGETFDTLMQGIYQHLDGSTVGGFYLMTKPYLMIRDPHLIRRIKLCDSAHFKDSNIVRLRFCGYPPGAHSIQSECVRHREVRRRIADTFGPDRTRRTFFLLQECCERVLAQLRGVCDQPGPVDTELRCIFARFATDVIGRCAFGIECGAIDDPASQFVRIGMKVAMSSRTKCLEAIISLASPKLSRLWRRRALASEGHELFSRVFRETLQHRERHGIQQDDAINLLRMVKNGEMCPPGSEEKPSPPLSDDALVSQLFMLFVVGFEMTSSVLTFCAFELAADQAVQTRARLEVDAVLRKHGGHLTYEAVMEMEYLGAVLSEALRLYPPIPVTFREVSVPYPVPGSSATLRPGDAACVPMAALQRDERFFPDSLQFRPERFLQKPDKVRHHGAYLPFGWGPHECIGKHFAMVEMKAVMASVLSRFELSPSLRSPPRPGNLAEAGRGLWVKVSPRIWYSYD